MIQTSHRQTLVVVGTGMAGAKVVEEVLARSRDRFHIRMFGAEPCGTYNRLLLSTYLSGFTNPAKLWLNPLEWYENRGVFVHSGVKVEHIDRQNQTVTGGKGTVTEPYDVLVLATGSRPFVPPIEGTNKRGVFVFRTLEDCTAIAAYAQNCDRVAVLGGGLLGLEAARGLLNFGLDVTVVEVAPHLMVQQVDAVGGALLQRKLEAMGISVLLGKSTTHVLGNESVTGLRFQDGSTLDTDMIVISCGIRPNFELARESGLAVDKAIIVDDHMRTSDPAIFAVGQCVQHRGKVYGLVDPVYEQARVVAEVLAGNGLSASYQGSRLVTTLKVMGIDVISMGEVNVNGADCEMVSHLDTLSGIYKKLVIRNNQLAGAILIGTSDVSGKLGRLFKSGEALATSAIDLLNHGCVRDALLADADNQQMKNLPDDVQICNCHAVQKGKIVEAIASGSYSLQSIGERTRAGTGCGTCQPLLSQLIQTFGNSETRPEKNKIEIIKAEKDGLDALPDILSLAANNNWGEMTEADKQRAKWHGLFFRPQTPGNFMLRLRFQGGRTNARQFRLLARLSDQFGKGFCDLTTRQQLQLRWFTLGDVPEIWRQLQEVGLHSMQTGMDNVRGICGCPLAGLTPHELLDGSPVIRAFDEILIGNKEFTNLPRKFNVTITGCLENCCHPETQDIGLVPAIRELEGRQVNGFNVLVGGKQGSGGYRPATSLDVFVRPEDAALLCAEITRVFRDHGSRASRVRARLAFLIDDRGIGWFRNELQRRWGKPLLAAGIDMRKHGHADHLGFNPQKRDVHHEGPQLYCVGFLVPVGRITTTQMRGVADLAERYGNGDIRITPQQNLTIANVPENRIGAMADEPLFQELPYDPSPIMRGLVACTGNDYCGMALIETKSYAIQVARELERRTAGRKLLPLSIHWSGCPAGCGLHQVATIGLQGCRSRVGGKIVDAAHVCVKGNTGPEPSEATDIMYDVPISRLPDALENLVVYLPR